MIDARGRDISLIIWCSEFRRGERPGVKLPAAQRHELALLVSKEPLMGGKATVSRTDTRPNVAKRYGLQLAPTGVSRHQPPRDGGQRQKYARRDLNPQPSVPKTDALSN